MERGMSVFEKVLFVFPETRYPSGQPPLGIASLSAILRSKSTAEPFLCDMSFLRRPFDTLGGMLSSIKPDLVSITVVTPQLDAALRTVRIVREKLPGAFVAIGGPHATVLPEETLEMSGADLVYSGEGERAFEMLLGGMDPALVPGSCLRRNGSVLRVPGRLLVEDLDQLPIPDRSLFDMQRYFRSWYSMDRVDSGLKGTSVMATRGCPFGCTFCQPTLSEIFGKKIRKRSPALIVEELEGLVADYGLTAFMFEDSTFILEKDWVHEICDRMMRSGLRLRWCCNVRADLLDADLLSHMKEAGLSKINMGVESASQRVLDDIYSKGITVDGVRRALALARSMGIMVQGYFMLGAPGETLEEMEQTIRFAAREPFDDALFDITTPFPHTELWNRTKHLVKKDYADFDCFHKCVYELEGIPAGTVERLKKRAFWKFYAHPSRILRTAATAFGPRNLWRTLLKARRV